MPLQPVAFIAHVPVRSCDIPARCLAYAPIQGTRERVACFEVLRGTLSVTNMIRDDKTFQLPSAMQMGRSQGMQTFDDALRELVRNKKISGEVAYTYASNREDFEALVPAEFLEQENSDNG